MPAPADWVNVRRVRIKDSVEYIWWLAKSSHPKADNRNVLQSYSPDMIRLNRRGVRATVRPSGHNIKKGFGAIDSGGSIPANIVEGEEHEPDSLLGIGNNAANDAYTTHCKEAGIKIHPDRFPAALPEFVGRLLTDEEDRVVDPFAGSNRTGAVA